MTSKAGGRPSKDQEILDNFNHKKLGPKASRETIRKAERADRLAKERLAMERRKQQETLDKMKKDALRQIATVKKDLGIKDPETPVDNPVDSSMDTSSESPEPTEKEDEKSAHQMLQDLRYAYRTSVGVDGKKGKMRLKQLMENDADFKFAVKELLKIEASLLAAKIRKDGGDGETKGIGQQNFFVVLKGLEDGPKMLEAALDKTVDLKQVSRAINPDQGEVYEAEEESRNAAPVQLSKVDNVEGW
jgi:hypothetical protein